MFGRMAYKKMGSQNSLSSWYGLESTLNCWSAIQATPRDCVENFARIVFVC